MINQDTIRLLRECDAGIQMGVSAIDEVMDRANAQALRDLLSGSKEEHERLGRSVRDALDRFGDEGKAPSPIAKTMSTAKTKTVTGNYGNLRADGGMSAKVLKVLTKGTVVSVVKEGKYWTCVDYNGTVGWIKKTYLK